MKIIVILITSMLLINACSKKDKINSTPINNFDVNKYLGQWYEIARTDNRFERGCTNVTANYSLRKDGGLNVVNKCLVNNKEKVATGKAFFKRQKNVGSLKVTFFWPFYGNYNIMYLDDHYQYAVIDGGSKKYIWILARTQTIDDKILASLLEKISQNSIDLNTLIYTKHRD